ncbi:hypothetical protein SISSUDRAFT_1041628 [Sistotremastrum suecicum HHB10207 ss-3]|uniref:Transmembrane protein n=1 Tax=Sistotremastrum suecicum HHB10207 ss-3 TaxID=1314776 RepID=A0A166H4C7_9AGAM|nr:hypothetical protein SISSUDRAFT_1041628 [Sistotremastrum suecicum HHB10207 ss-3]
MNLRPQHVGDPSKACSQSQEEQFQTLLSHVKHNEVTAHPAQSDASHHKRGAAKKGCHSRSVFLELASAFLAGMIFTFVLLFMISPNRPTSCSPSSIIKGLIFHQPANSASHSFASFQFPRFGEGLPSFSNTKGSRVSDAPTNGRKEKEKGKEKGNRKGQKKRGQKKKSKGKTEAQGGRRVKGHGRSKDAGHKHGRRSNSGKNQQTNAPGQP